MHAKHLCHDLVQVIQSGDCLNINSEEGKGHSTWIWVTKSQGGHHRFSLDRVAKPLRLANDIATEKCSSTSRKRIAQKLVRDIGIISTLAMYKSNTMGKNYDSPQCRGSEFPATSKGNDWQGSKKLNRLFVQLTRLSIRIHGTTLGALTYSNMPDFQVIKLLSVLKIKYGNN